MRKTWGMGSVAAVAALLLAPACGGGSKTATTTTTRETTTTVAPQKVVVTPPAGGVGTVFTFTVQGFESGEHIHFEVVFPDGHTFVGQSHPVGQDGTYSAPYTATKGNPLGTYTVKAIGDQGSTAEGKFDLTSGPAGSSGSATSTTAKKSTGTSTAGTLPGE
jgi:hypothetical protein